MGNGQVTVSAPVRSLRVTAPDGVTVAVQEWGNLDGPAILFVHGGFGSHLNWARQFRSDLARDFRMVTYDLRGHGLSDKPLAPEFYTDPARWAGELASVMEQAGLTSPVLVGWSYGSRVLLDYLTTHGDGAVAGLNLVGANPNAVLNTPDPDAVAALSGLASSDLLTRIHAMQALVRSFFAAPPAAGELEAMIACAALVPREVCAPMLARPTPYEATLEAIGRPVLVSHGTEDMLAAIAVARYAVATIPTARGSFYEGVGHGPFWERPDRFNRELREFVQAQA